MTLISKRTALPRLSALSSAIMLMSGLTSPVLAQAAEEDDVIRFTVEKQIEVTQSQNQVAFVPFAGNSTLSNIVQKDLENSPLSVTSQGLIGQPHTRDDLAATLPAWQQLGITYLVIGTVKTVGGNTVADFEVIEVAKGRIIKGKQSVSDSDAEVAAHKAAGRIYELLSGDREDLNARIVYVEEKGEGANKTSSLKLINADGSNPKLLTQVTDASIISPAVSPDGRYLAYSVQLKNNAAQLFKYDMQTRQITQLVDLKGSSFGPSFSPDGSTILFSNSQNGDHDIYRVSSMGGVAEPIIEMPNNQLQPSYGPDGSFVFVSDHASPRRPSIYRYNFRGPITKLSRESYAANPCFSPDGTKIGYLSGGSAAVMSLNGAVLNNFGVTNIDEAPCFSPTSHRVVYAQGKKQSKIVIRYLNGGKTITLPIDGRASSPIWIPSR